MSATAMGFGGVVRRAFCLLPVWAALILAGPVHAADAPPIAVAANLQVAMEEIAAAFEADTGEHLKLTFGSSGNFFRQIRQGAPFELFFSADEQYVRDLARDGITRDKGTLYGIGRIVLVVPRSGSPLKADGSLGDLKAAIAEGRVKRFAIASPEHAPYGLAAKQALQHEGLWEPLQSHIVFGENVSQTALFATSGNAEGGIIAYSLALSPNVTKIADHALIPAEWHAPLNQRMVLLEDAGPVAERFYTYVQTAPARAIFRKYGYVLPGESS
jgi:molybdate transport system substrate-binding protein